MNISRIFELRRDDAVSPIVGVMLMLVVTIIIAAVVSGFAGGLTASAQKAPNLMMDVEIKNTGYPGSSSIFYQVLSASEPISTRDLRITTSWTTTNKISGERISGGATVVAGTEPNTNLRNGTSQDHIYHSPLGFGTGVTPMNLGIQKGSTPYDYGQFFGNYSLMPGTSMKNSAGYGGGFGYGQAEPFAYSYGGLDSGFPPGAKCGMMANLGEEWYHLRAGDTVNVMITHIPSGQVIFQKNVVVQ
jgi:FlaG/FlaF family flagellin (archaellin)